MATAYGVDPVVRYNAGARAFHAAIAVLVVVNLALGLLHESLEKQVDLMPLHKSIGITILGIGVLRLLWRLTWKKPAYDPPIAGWERLSSAVVHWALYALMLVMPLTGWIFSSPGKRPLEWFGLAIPKLPVERGSALVESAHEGHEILGFVMLALVIGHVVAALRHHYVLRDHVLRRIW